MYAIICLRQSAAGGQVVIPIMEDDEKNVIGDSMATFESMEEAEEFCLNHILCKSSQNIIVDLDDPEETVFA